MFHNMGSDYLKRIILNDQANRNPDEHDIS